MYKVTRSLLQRYFLLSLVTPTLGCSTGTPLPPPVELLPGLMSQASPARVANDFGIDRKSWHVLEDMNLAGTDKRPPYHSLVVRVSRFQPCGESDGMLKFFNDQLIGVVCYPTDFAAFVKPLALQHGLQFDKGEVRGRAGPRISVFSGTDSSGKRFVIIEDEAVREEVNRWLRRYS